MKVLYESVQANKQDLKICKLAHMEHSSSVVFLIKLQYKIF
jgi:hypothetical protein